MTSHGRSIQYIILCKEASALQINIDDMGRAAARSDQKLNNVNFRAGFCELALTQMVDSFDTVKWSSKLSD